MKNDLAYTILDWKKLTTAEFNKWGEQFSDETVNNDLFMVAVGEDLTDLTIKKEPHLVAIYGQLYTCNIRLVL